MNIKSAVAQVGLDKDPPNEHDRKVALDELRETEDLVESAVAQLRALIEEDGSIEVPTDQQFLLKFLRPTKFYVPSALALVSFFKFYMNEWVQMWYTLSEA